MTDRAAPGGWWGSLHARLILLLLTGFVLLAGFAVYETLRARRHEIADGRAAVEQFAKLAENELATNIRETRQLLHAMAGNPALRGSDLAACSAALAEQLKRGTRYGGFYVSDGNGALLCHSDPVAPSTNYSDRDYFRRAVQTRQPAVGNPVLGRTLKRSVLPLAHPLLNARGEVERVLVAGLDLA